MPGSRSSTGMPEGSVMRLSVSSVVVDAPTRLVTAALSRSIFCARFDGLDHMLQALDMEGLRHGRDRAETAGRSSIFAGTDLEPVSGFEPLTVAYKRVRPWSGANATLQLSAHWPA